MSGVLKKVLQIDLDDTKVQNFYQDLRRKSLNIHIENFTLSEEAQKKVRKKTQKSIASGIEEGAKKGSDSFQRGFLGKLSLLETQINKSFLTPIEKIQAPMNSLFSGLSSLSGLFLGGGAIGGMISLVGDLTTRLREFSQVNQKFRETLSSNLEIRGIETLIKDIERLSEKTNLSRETLSSFLLEMKKMGVAREDVTAHMSFLEGVLGRIGKVAPENFSKLVGILKSVEEGVKLSSRELKTLNFLVGEEATAKIEELGREGKLTFESFSKSIEKLGKESKGFLSKNLESLSQKIIDLKHISSSRSRIKAYGALEGSQHIPTQRDLERTQKEVGDLLKKSLEDIQIKIPLTPDKVKWQNEIEKIRDEMKRATPFEFFRITGNVEKLSQKVSLQYQTSQESKGESDLEKLQKLQDKWTTLMNLPEEYQKKLKNLSFDTLMEESANLEKTLLGMIESLAQKAQNKEQWDFVALLSKSAQEFKKTLPPSLSEVEKNLSSLKSKIKETNKTKLTIQTHPEIFEKLSFLKKELEAIQKIKGSLSEKELEIHLKLTKEVKDIESNLSLSKEDNKERDAKISQGVSIGTQALAGLIEKVGKKDYMGAGLSIMGSVGQTLSMLPGGQIPGAIISGVAGILGAVDGFMKAGIEREMEAIHKQDALFLEEYKKTKDKEIEARKTHIKELDEQFSKTKSVYERAFEEGAISSEEYAHHMRGASEGYQKSKKEDEDALEIATRQKQMLENYISRREEIEKTKKETERWGFGFEDSESSANLARINEAISRIQGAKSLEDLKKYPEKAIHYAYHGYQGYTNNPTLFMTSEMGQKEHVSITPSYRLGEENSPSGISIGNIEIHINSSGLTVNALSNELVDALFMRLKERMQRGMYGGR